MYLVPLFIELILLGVCFFLWVQLNREGFVSDSSAPTQHSVAPKPKKQAKARPVQSNKSAKSLFKSKKSKKSIEEDLSDDLDWENIGTIQRDKSSFEEQRSMDDLLFPTKNEEPPKRLIDEEDSFKPSKTTQIEDQFKDLFSEEEREELARKPEPIRREETYKPSKEMTFENFEIGADESDEYNSGEEYDFYSESRGLNFETNDKKDDDDLSFLNRHDFSYKGEEEINDSIFDVARSNKETTFESEPNFDSSVDDWNPNDNIPPGLNFDINELDTYEETKEFKPSFPETRSGFTIEDDDDEEVLKSLRKLTDELDKSK